MQEALISSSEGNCFLLYNNINTKLDIPSPIISASEISPGIFQLYLDNRTVGASIENLTFKIAFLKLGTMKILLYEKEILSERDKITEFAYLLSENLIMLQDMTAHDSILLCLLELEFDSGKVRLLDEKKASKGSTLNMNKEYLYISGQPGVEAIALKSVIASRKFDSAFQVPIRNNLPMLSINETSDIVVASRQSYRFIDSLDPIFLGL